MSRCMFREQSKRWIWAPIIAVSFYVTGCGYDGPIITVHELKATLDDSKRGMSVIDVRPAIQFKKGHVPGAKNYPLEKLEQSWKSLTSIKEDIAIICTCGRRSLAAIKKLTAKGITTTLVEGGMKQWEAAGYPLEV